MVATVLIPFASMTLPSTTPPFTAILSLVFNGVHDDFAGCDRVVIGNGNGGRTLDDIEAGNACGGEGASHKTVFDDLVLDAGFAHFVTHSSVLGNGESAIIDENDGLSLAEFLGIFGYLLFFEFDGFS